MTMIRCKDIAEMVGVSRQAVTAVLNNSRPNCVSPEKREEILKIAARYNYRPNHAAKALKTGKSNVIGIVMPPWDNPYIAELCMALQRTLAAENYTPFFTIDNNYNPVPGNLEQLLSLQVAGMITVASSLLPDNLDIPVVSYYYDDPRFDSVCPNAKQDSQLIIEHLKENGHKKIAYLGILNDQRVKHLAAEAERCGLTFPEYWRIDCSEKNCEDALKQLLEYSNDLPTALIIHNDALAFKLMRYIREKGLRIPEDLSVIGHNNITFCKYSAPALTSVSFGSAEEIADTMVKLLMEQINSPEKSRKKVLLQSALSKRESVLDLNRN